MDEDLGDPFEVRAFKNTDLTEWHKCSDYNKEQIAKSTLVGCFYCGTISAALNVTEWIDKGQTGMCPECGIDALIADVSVPSLTMWLLRAMYDRWFGTGHALKKDPETGKMVTDPEVTHYTPRSW